MGLIQELSDLIGQLNFVAIVHEYEQGLYFRRGIAVEKPIRGMKPEEVAELKTAERKAMKDLGAGRFLPGRRKARWPEGFRRTWAGSLRHQRRFSKVLRPGIYFHLPIIEHIVKDYKQERVLRGCAKIT